MHIVDVVEIFKEVNGFGCRRPSSFDVIDDHWIHLTHYNMLSVALQLLRTQGGLVLSQAGL